MYLYLYDSFLATPKYQKTIDKIEGRLTDLGISGRIAKLTIIKNASEIIKESLRKDIQTVVVVGGDILLCEAATSLVNQPATLGFIPVGPSTFGEILGIPPDEFGCEILSARRIANLDIGKINNQYFFSSVLIKNREVNVRCEGSYQINPLTVKNLKVVNLDFLFPQKNGEHKVSNPFDGLLEIIFSTEKKGLLSIFKKKEYQDSIFYLKKIKIDSKKEKEIPLMVDRERILKTPAEIEVVPAAIKIIVGRDRLVQNQIL